MIGTNPLAYAIPAEDGDAFVLDMATTTVALGKLEIARRLGKPFKAGWAIDAQGVETTDPVAGMGGALLTAGRLRHEGGGHKGYGLGLLVDILCGVLGGGTFGPDLHRTGGLLDPGIVSHFFAAIRIDGFRDQAQFKADVSRELREMRESRTAPGVERVFTAGDPEALKTEEAYREGIGLDPVVVESLRRVAGKLGIAGTLAARVFTKEAAAVRRRSRARRESAARGPSTRSARPQRFRSRASVRVRLKRR